MEEFHSSEDNTESSNGSSDEEVGQDSQPLLEIHVSVAAPAVPVSQESSCSSTSLRPEGLKFLGPEVCPPSKAALRTPRSSALQQSLLKSSEESRFDKSLPGGNLVSSCL